jgi:Pyruvate/2-oxoacid:ferredoxin oxidoreductase gamma subunit
METLIEAVRIMVPSKIEANLQAVKEAYEQVKIFEVEG